uniref:Centromere protein S n=2 Tax=Chenopodium quinoa TaxID=63459 RepID=A0A803LCE5_CHEQI
MQASESIVACISNLAFNYAEHLAKDLELFAHHAGRKLVNTEDVILAAHRNENLSLSLRTFCNDLKAKEPQSERKRKKASRKEDKATTSALETADL